MSALGMNITNACAVLDEVAARVTPIAIAEAKDRHVANLSRYETAGTLAQVSNRHLGLRIIARLELCEYGSVDGKEELLYATPIGDAATLAAGAVA